MWCRSGYGEAGIWSGGGLGAWPCGMVGEEAPSGSEGPLYFVQTVTKEQMELEKCCKRIPYRF